MLSDKTLKKLKGIEKCSTSGRHKVGDLFKIALECRDLWDLAYANISKNKGGMTAGIDGSTLDGHSRDRIENLLKLLKENRYYPRPSRRVSIPKTNGKRRPLGIIGINDKLVQEVWRILLEKAYEPVFHDDSHGFRPGRSCHTALEGIHRTWNGTKWFIEFDIKGYFDNICHRRLVTIIKKRVKDRKFISVIKRMLKAGYVEEWKYFNTYSGTPQGGIASPILANIYLHELDEHIHSIQKANTRGKSRKENLIYGRYRARKGILSKKIKEAKKLGNTEQALKLVDDWKKLGKLQRSIPSKDPHDPNYRRLRYCRYADDFLLGFIGSKQEALEIKDQTTQFLKSELSLDISKEKSGVSHASEGIEFLGYSVKSRSNDMVSRVIWHGRPTLKRTKKENIDLQIPTEKLKKFSQNKKYGSWHTHKAMHRGGLIANSDVEIVLQYNAEMRGIANYYSLAKHAKGTLKRLYSLWYLSLCKTLAAKYRSSVRKINVKLKSGDRLALKSKGKKYPIFQLKHWEPKQLKFVDTLPNVSKYNGRTEIVARLNASRCEYCGTTKGYFEVHHIKKMKDIKKGKHDWQKHMIARNRKTLVLCRDCHRQLHSGKLPDKRFFNGKMESAMP